MKLFLPGMVLPFQKGDAAKRPPEAFIPSEPLRIPLTMTPDAEAAPTLLAETGDRVPAGAVLLQSEKELPAIANCAGRLEGTLVLNHPQYGEMLCAELYPEGDERELLPVTPAGEISADTILEAARDAAIYDELDGACLIDKLNAWQLPKDDAVALRSVLVADATENDIFGSAAWAALDTDPAAALDGLQLAAKALHFTHYHIATMLPKEKRRALKRAIGRNNIYIVGDEYPVSVFADGSPEVFRIGIQACIALSKAVRCGKKATGAIVTVAGSGVRDSRNLVVPYGTQLREILSFCKAVPEATVILGDAMNGIVCTDTSIPLLPGITTLLVMQSYPVRVPRPCIGCGRCAAVCHAELLPYEIVRRYENMHFERLQHLSPADCDGCGLCSYVCPSQREVAAGVLAAGESHGAMFLNWEDGNDE